MAGGNHNSDPWRGLMVFSWIATLVLIVALGWSVALVLTPGAVPTPAAVTRAAERLGSQVATSAAGLLPHADQLPQEPAVRPMSPHIIPSPGKPVPAHVIKVAYNGVTYLITPHVTNDVYWGAKKSTRFLTQLPGESEADWTTANYHAFADDPAQKPAIDDICRQLRAIRVYTRLSTDQYLELIAKYVQSIPYDWASSDSGAGRQRFPVETLVDGIGLCGDKSVLLADLLAHEGYATALLDFGPEKHMAVGVMGQGTTYAQSGYLFLETTSPCYVTDVPTEYAGGMHLHSVPVVIPIGSGKLQYSAADQIAKIIAARQSAQGAADQLYATSKAQRLTATQVAAVNVKLQQAYRAQTSLRGNVVDRNGKAVGAFMDRMAALAWISRNAWWM